MTRIGVPTTQETFGGSSVHSRGFRYGSGGTVQSPRPSRTPRPASLPRRVISGEPKHPRLSKRKHGTASSSGCNVARSSAFRRQLRLEARGLLAPGRLGVWLLPWPAGPPGDLSSPQGLCGSRAAPRGLQHAPLAPQGPIPLLLEAVLGLGPSGPGAAPSGLALPRGPCFPMSPSTPAPAH